MQSNSMPKPFPLHQQYVKAVAAAAETAPGEDGEVGDEPIGKSDPKPKGNKNKKTDNQPSKCAKKESHWQYGTLRKEFIAKQMKDKVGYQDAVSMWDSSNEKAVYLSDVTVGELKRRKFLKAGATTNPWYDQLNPS